MKEKYVSPPLGNEITCIMRGLNRSWLVDNKLIRPTILAALKKDRFTILGYKDYIFQPQGYSITILLAESHASIHTYPEYHCLVFNLYSCRGQGDGVQTLNTLKRKLRPKEIKFYERAIKIGGDTLSSSKHKKSVRKAAPRKSMVASRSRSLRA
jgi:S-adenosylmethionine decarboxylase